MAGLLPDIDPDGLLEFSVVYTDRALNHMSGSFQTVMNDISSTLKEVYSADAVAVIPGSGTFGMEAVARQFATGNDTLVIRNGWFSYRWTQIFEAGGIPSSSNVLMARQLEDATHSPFVPPPVDEVVDAIKANAPKVVFAPHVETSAGMMLPDDYIAAVADAVHGVGGLFVLDCIASGTRWVDMAATGVDVLCSAPQKGWSSTPSSGLVMMSSRAVEAMEDTTSTSFACDLKKWHQIMAAYENGGHAYHATMPTDSLRAFRDTLMETKAWGFDKAMDAQVELGARVRELLSEAGFVSVAGQGFEAPGVVVSFTSDPELKSGKKFAEAGVQIAGGVPLSVGERDDFSTFRIGLFGLDKLKDVDATVASFAATLERITS